MDSSLIHEPPRGYRFGLIRDDGRHPRRHFRELRSRLDALPSGGADLRPFNCPVYDQNWVGSCVENGTQTAAATTLAAKGTPLGFDPSVLFGYQLDLRLDRAHDYPLRRPEDMPALQDRGTQILTAATRLGRYGVRPMGQHVVVGGIERYSDCSPENATTEGAIDLAAIEEGATKLVVGAYEIEHSASRKTEMKLTLDANISLSVGGWVDSKTYLPYGPSSPPIGAQDLYDLDGGGHCTELCGYQTDASGVTLWLIKGSWGKGWGQAGYGWVTDEFVDQLWEVFALDVEVEHA